MEVTFERVQACRPHRLPAGEPSAHLSQWSWLECARHRPPLLGTRNQAGSLQDTDVFHEPRQRHAMGPRQFADGASASAQFVEGRASGGVRQSGEYTVERAGRVGTLILNHKVQRITGGDIGQAQRDRSNGRGRNG